MSQQETHGFQTEVKQLLHLMIHSLYSNKEIFLRELVSNAADAADKLRYLALTNDALYEGDGELRVRISADKEKGTVTIEDNGVAGFHVPGDERVLVAFRLDVGQRLELRRFDRIGSARRQRMALLSGAGCPGCVDPRHHRR